MIWQDIEIIKTENILFSLLLILKYQVYLLILWNILFLFLGFHFVKYRWLRHLLFSKIENGTALTSLFDEIKIIFIQ